MDGKAQMTDLQIELFALQDLAYRDFHSKLIPTVPKDRIIGIRTPLLRKFAKNFFKSGGAEKFLDALPHKYYEENNLHAFCIEQIKDYSEVIRRLDAFLPYIDNWATCDSMLPKIFFRHREELLLDIKRWINNGHTYTVRFGIEMLMRLYLDEYFSVEYLEIAASVRSVEYYVNMMTAWFFATALAKQYDHALVFIEKRRLDAWTHNKAIQKAIESYRITPEQKAYLRGLKIK